MRSLILLIFAASTFAQNFPTTVSTTATLPGAANRARTTLATSVNNSITTVVLTSAASFAVNTPFTIGTEDIICTTLMSNTFSGCTRGYDGSTAASHTAGVAVTGTIIAAHNNKLRLEVIALEQQAAARSLDYCADAGANDTYTCSLAPPPSSYATGAHYRFKANTANTGAATINFNSLGAKTIVKVAGGVTSTLDDNDILSGQVVELVYDGTNMQMQSTSGKAKLPLTGGTLTGEVIAVPTTGAYAVDLQKSGSSGTMQIYDQTPTTGATKFVLRSGAGQSTTALQQWLTAAGNIGSQVDGTGALNNFDASTGTNKKVSIYDGVYIMSSGAAQVWCSGSSVDSCGGADTGLSRNAAGVVEINSSVAGTYRDLKLRSPQVTTNTEATCDSSVRGTLVMVQGGAGVADTFRVCAKDASDTYAWTPLF